MRQFCGCVAMLLCGTSVALGEDRSASPANTTDSVSTDSVSTVRRLLETGLRPGLDNYRKAEQIWRQSPSASKRDPRTDFAWGLILRRHSKNREAERQFLVAAGHSNHPYSPARQAAAWMKLARGQTASGLSQVDTLVREITGKAAMKPEHAIAAANWVGRVVAALHETELSRRDQTRLLATHRRAEQRLKGKLRKAYDEGLLVTEVQTPDKPVVAKPVDIARQARIKKRQQEEIASKKKSLAGKKKSLAGKRKDLQLTAEQWEEWIKSRTSTTTQTLKRLMQEMDVLEGRRQALGRSMTLITREYMAKQRGSGLAYDPNPISRQSSRQASQARLAREEQYRVRKEREYNAYRRTYLATVESMRKFRQQGSAAVQQYRAAVKRYEAANGALIRQNGQLAKWDTRLKRKQAELSKPAFRASLTAKKQKQSEKRFSRFVTFDLDRERKRLLAEVSNQSP